MHQTLLEVLIKETRGQRLPGVSQEETETIKALKELSSKTWKQALPIYTRVFDEKEDFIEGVAGLPDDVRLAILERLDHMRRLLLGNEEAATKKNRRSKKGGGDGGSILLQERPREEELEK